MMDASETHREPRQSRSRASFERMLIAAEQLMALKGNDDFALTDVAKAGKVSIGSIYCRFDSKDSLVQAVQQRVLLRLQKRQSELIARIALETDSLTGFVARLVDEFSELLSEFAPILRPMMLRAARDPVVSEAGRASHGMVVADVTRAMLRYRDDIAHPDPERAVQAAFNLLYAALARALSLGSSEEAAVGVSWQQLKMDCAHMCGAFLKNAPSPNLRLQIAEKPKKTPRPPRAKAR